MRIDRARRRARAFSLIELLCVMAIIGVLAALLLPALSRARAQARRVQCVSNLRQVGIAFQNFAQDHNGQFPMSVPVNAGGTLEFARNAYGIAGEFYFSFRHFQVLSNELVTPKMVVCPADTRQPATSFNNLQNQEVSYFVGISAVPAASDSILAGDRNLTNDWSKPATLLRFGPNSSLRWTAELHQFKGNLLFADGRVEERNTPGLGGNGTKGFIMADLSMPTIPTSAASVDFGQASGSGASPISGTPLKPEPAISPVHPVPAGGGSAGAAAQSSPTPEITATPGWRIGSSAGQSQPDSPPLSLVPLPPGTNRFVTNSTVGSAQTTDPGFSLFPPLLGQNGILHSTGGHWSLLILVFLLLLTATILLKRRLARSQLLRRTYHEILRMF